jgi:hypothetical protein
VDLEVLEVGVAPRLRRHLGDVEQVVDVAVEVEAGGEHGVHRLARLRERDGDMEEEIARSRVCDDGSLVTHDEIVELRLLEVRAHCSEHSPRDDDDVGTRRPRPRERVPGARPQHAVLGDQRPVEIEREGGDVRRKRGGEVYGAVPPVDWTT